MGKGKAARLPTARMHGRPRPAGPAPMLVAGDRPRHGAISKNPLAILDPNRAGQFFSPLTIGGLAPQYQAGFRKKQGKK